MEGTDVQAIVKQAIQEFLQEQQAKSEPAYKTELVEERRRREQLERRLNEVEEESKRSRQAADQAERSSAIRAELQRLGVAKVDLAYRAVQDGVLPRGGRPFAGAQRGGRGAAERISEQLRERESGVFAGTHPGRVGDHASTQSAAGEQRERGH